MFSKDGQIHLYKMVWDICIKWSSIVVWPYVPWRGINFFWFPWVAYQGSNHFMFLFIGTFRAYIQKFGRYFLNRSKISGFQYFVKLRFRLYLEYKNFCSSLHLKLQDSSFTCKPNSIRRKRNIFHHFLNYTFFQ